MSTTSNKFLVKINNNDISGNSRYIAIATDNGTRIFNLATKEEVCYPNTAEVGQVAFSFDSRYVVSGLDDGSVQVYDFMNQQEKILFENNVFGTCAISLL